MTKEMKFYKCYYQLTADAKWKFMFKIGDKIYLEKQQDKLFNCETEKWNLIPKNNLIITRDLTFCNTATLSMFDVEVLEGYGFKENKNLK